MQRSGSTKNSWGSAMSMATLGFAQTRGAHLVFGDLRNRVLGRNGQLVGALASAPVVRNKYGVGPNRVHHSGPQRGGAAPRFRGRPVAIRQSQLGGKLRMNFDVGIRTLVQQRADTASLLARKEMADYAPGRENERVLGVGHFRGR